MQGWGATSTILLAGWSALGAMHPRNPLIPNLHSIRPHQHDIYISIPIPSVGSDHYNFQFPHIFFFFSSSSSMRYIALCRCFDVITMSMSMNEIPIISFSNEFSYSKCT